jgi:hypothetical protein
LRERIHPPQGGASFAETVMLGARRLPDIKGKVHLPAFTPQIRNAREGPARGTQEPDEFKAIQAGHVIQEDPKNVPVL